MDYKPRYAQPFTLSEAVGLDVSVITEEIARLQNSLQHLRDTQTILHENVASEPPEDLDPEITKAIEENETVIGSQEERISILRMALAEKGILGGSHYDLAPAPPVSPRTVPEATTTATAANGGAGSDEGEGIHL